METTTAGDEWTGDRAQDEADDILYDDLGPSMDRSSDPIEDQSNMSALDLYTDMVIRDSEEVALSLAKLEEEKRSFKSQLDEALQEVNKLSTENETLKKENQVLKGNISVLLKTAKMELQRKERELKELREREIGGRGSGDQASNISPMKRKPRRGPAKLRRMETRRQNGSHQAPGLRGDQSASTGNRPKGDGDAEHGLPMQETAFVQRHRAKERLGAAGGRAPRAMEGTPSEFVKQEKKDDSSRKGRTQVDKEEPKTKGASDADVSEVGEPTAAQSSSYTPKDILRAKKEVVLDSERKEDPNEQDIECPKASLGEDTQGKSSRIQSREHAEHRDQHHELSRSQDRSSRSKSRERTPHSKLRDESPQGEDNVPSSEVARKKCGPKMAGSAETKGSSESKEGGDISAEIDRAGKDRVGEGQIKGNRQSICERLQQESKDRSTRSRSGNTTSRSRSREPSDTEHKHERSSRSSSHHRSRSKSQEKSSQSRHRDQSPRSDLLKIDRDERTHRSQASSAGSRSESLKYDRGRETRDLRLKIKEKSSNQRKRKDVPERERGEERRRERDRRKHTERQRSSTPVRESSRKEFKDPNENRKASRSESRESKERTKRVLDRSQSRAKDSVAKAKATLNKRLHPSPVKRDRGQSRSESLSLDRLTSRSKKEIEEDSRDGQTSRSRRTEKADMLDKTDRFKKEKDSKRKREERHSSISSQEGARNMKRRRDGSVPYDEANLKKRTSSVVELEADDAFTYEEGHTVLACGTKTAIESTTSRITVMQASVSDANETTQSDTSLLQAAGNGESIPVAVGSIADGNEGEKEEGELSDGEINGEEERKSKGQSNKEHASHRIKTHNSRKHGREHKRTQYHSGHTKSRGHPPEIPVTVTGRIHGSGLKSEPTHKSTKNKKENSKPGRSEGTKHKRRHSSDGSAGKRKRHRDNSFSVSTEVKAEKALPERKEAFEDPVLHETWQMETELSIQPEIAQVPLNTEGSTEGIPAFKVISPTDLETDVIDTCKNNLKGSTRDVEKDHSKTSNSESDSFMPPSKILKEEIKPSIVSEERQSGYHTLQTSEIEAKEMNEQKTTEGRDRCGHNRDISDIETKESVEQRPAKGQKTVGHQEDVKETEEHRVTESCTDQLSGKVLLGTTGTAEFAAVVSNFETDASMSRGVLFEDLCLSSSMDDTSCLSTLDQTAESQNSFLNIMDKIEDKAPADATAAGIIKDSSVSEQKDGCLEIYASLLGVHDASFASPKEEPSLQVVRSHSQNLTANPSKKDHTDSVLSTSTETLLGDHSKLSHSQNFGTPITKDVIEECFDPIGMFGKSGDASEEDNDAISVLADSDWEGSSQGTERPRDRDSRTVIQDAKLSRTVQSSCQWTSLDFCDSSTKLDAEPSRAPVVIEPSLEDGCARDMDYSLELAKGAISQVESELTKDTIKDTKVTITDKGMSESIAESKTVVEVEEKKVCRTENEFNEVADLDSSIHRLESEIFGESFSSGDLGGGECKKQSAISASGKEDSALTSQEEEADQCHKEGEGSPDDQVFQAVVPVNVASVENEESLKPMTLEKDHIAPSEEFCTVKRGEKPPEIEGYPETEGVDDEDLTVRECAKQEAESKIFKQEQSSDTGEVKESMQDESVPMTEGKEESGAAEGVQPGSAKRPIAFSVSEDEGSEVLSYGSDDDDDYISGRSDVFGDSDDDLPMPHQPETHGDKKKERMNLNGEIETEVEMIDSAAGDRNVNCVRDSKARDVIKRGEEWTVGAESKQQGSSSAADEGKPGPETRAARGGSVDEKQTNSEPDHSEECVEEGEISEGEIVSGSETEQNERESVQDIKTRKRRNSREDRKTAHRQSSSQDHQGPRRAGRIRGGEKRKYDAVRERPEVEHGHHRERREREHDDHARRQEDCRWECKVDKRAREDERTRQEEHKRLVLERKRRQLEQRWSETRKKEDRLERQRRESEEKERRRRERTDMKSRDRVRETEGGRKERREGKSLLDGKEDRRGSSGSREKDAKRESFRKSSRIADGRKS